MTILFTLDGNCKLTEDKTETIIMVLKVHGKDDVTANLATEILKRQRRFADNARVIRKELFKDSKLMVHTLKVYGWEVILVVLALVLTAIAVFKSFSKRM